MIITMVFGCSSSEPQRSKSYTRTSDTADLIKDDAQSSSESENKDIIKEVEKEVVEVKTFQCGGADLQKSVMDDLMSCHKKGRFYDRGDEKCTKLNLAQIDCTAKGLRKKMTSKQKSAFDDALDGAFEGYEVDQCIDCAADVDNSLCELDNDAKTGTMVFMIKPDGTEVKRTPFFFAGRPFQKEDDSVGATCEIEDEDEDEE